MATVESRSCQCFDSDAGEAVQLFGRRMVKRCLITRRALRRVARPFVGAALGLVLLVMRAPVEAAGLQDPTPPPVGSAAQQGRPADALHSGPVQEPPTQRIEEHMAQRRNAERQRMLEADTERLLLLAQQLKVEVDKSNKDMLSIDVVKRAEQIEKLARSVKEKMRGN